MNTQADPVTRETLKRARRVSGRERTLTRRQQASEREAQQREADQRFAALLASRAGSQTSGAY